MESIYKNLNDWACQIDGVFNDYEVSLIEVGRFSDARQFKIEARNHKSNQLYCHTIGFAYRDQRLMREALLKAMIDMSWVIKEHSQRPIASLRVFLSKIL